MISIKRGKISLVTKTQENWDRAKLSGDLNKLNTFCIFETDNKYGFPEVESSDFKPGELIPFHLSKKKKQEDRDKVVHFFLDDYKFESVWSNPRKFIDLFSFYEGIISPTFSIWSNQPHALNMYNMYRSRWCSRFYQEFGVNVLIDVRWADKDSYDLAFSGIEKGSNVIVNTVGTYRLENRRLFREGFEEMLERVQPKELYVYGEYMPVNFEDYFNQVHYFESFWAKRRAEIETKVGDK